jgi:hypothetical protein
MSGHGRKKGKDGQQQDVFACLSKRGVCQDAEAHRVVWARVKGYPWWPVSLFTQASGLLGRTRAHAGSSMRLAVHVQRALRALIKTM